MGMYLIL